MGKEFEALAYQTHVHLFFPSFQSLMKYKPSAGYQDIEECSISRHIINGAKTIPLCINFFNVHPIL